MPPQRLEDRPFSLRHRPEIDGLRAIAVVPVILFHAGFTSFRGGFVGVDVFFVISGYLIASLIADALAAGSFSLAAFYERRIRRIFPALAVVGIACIPFAWFWMMPGEFLSFAQSLVAVNAFISNILFWRETSYFSPDVELKPLLHTWSLAVEEQFYLTFPLLLMLLWRLGRRSMLAILFVLTAASLALAQWASAEHAAAAFYLLPTRAWQLGVGALVALAAPLQPAKTRSSWTSDAGALAGLALILGSIGVFHSGLPHPSLWTLAPVLGTAAVIVFASPRTLVGRLLSWRPLVGVGLVSYSAYLWHQPLFAFARLRNNESTIPAAGYLALIAATFTLAYLTWRFIEQPFRRGFPAPRLQTFLSAGATAGALIAAGFMLRAEDHAPGRLKPDALAMAAWSLDRSPYRGPCHGPRDPEQACVYGQGAGRPLYVWGDSQGVELAWRLSLRLDSPIVHLTHPDCVPSPGVHSPYQSTRESCVEFNRRVFDHLMGLPPGAGILMIGRWPESLENGEFDNGEGGVEPRKFERAFVPLDRGGEFLDDPGRADAVGAIYRATIQQLLDRGHLVILVYPVPEVGWNAPYHLAREIQFGARNERPLSTSLAVFRERSRSSYEQLDRLADHPRLVRIRPADAFCDTVEPGRCLVELDGAPLYLDYNHPNSLGADMIAGLILAALPRDDR